MADLCGPSNGAKNLVSHAERNRSLHQDRLVDLNARDQGGPSFRSQPAFSNGSEDTFATFQNGAPAAYQLPSGPQIPMSMGASGVHLGGINGLGAGHGPTLRSSGYNIGSAPPSFGLQSPQVGPIAGSSTSIYSHGGASQEWVGQFGSMQLQNNSHAAAMPAMAFNSRIKANPSHLFNQPTMGYGPAAQSYGVPIGGTGAMGHHAQFGGAIHSPVVHDSQSADIQGTMDTEAFNRAFGDYDEEGFQQELAEWKEEEVQADPINKELADAQDEWMAQHGPVQSPAPPTAQEMNAIDANLEVLAEDLESRRALGDPAVLPTRDPKAEVDRRHREDENLARAALDILQSVSENQSQKFRNSSFLDLMRRIGNREVVVEGPNLVDASTGETVVSKEGYGVDERASRVSRVSPIVSAYNPPFVLLGSVPPRSPERS
ncbi:hypothetical protein B0T25DRAFT_520157 [Lasiosphaeria hispida]|uniref:Peroxin 20 n=1 Tax=Lasiosphaeria hispida TaxID=260671 RepID=A0AAJ0MCY2_9PEZI|nr:hypothetical protein B0T25DRAFT_520157 [Lasiosphaeria hispida]